MKYLVLDTNILLIDGNNLVTLGQDYTIVLPETTLDEIDAKKSSPNPEIRYQVRVFGRLMQSKIRNGISQRGPLTITDSTLDGVNIEVVSRSEYPMFLSTEPSIRNDNKIIQIAKDYLAEGKDVTFMTNDVMCSERAAAAGLHVIDLKLIDDVPIEFTKQLDVSSEDFPSLHNKHILDIDPSYEIMYYNYMFRDIDTGQIKLANIRNGLIDILGKETESELRRQDATPSNAGQLFLSRAIQNPNVDIVVCEASAGTGKTVSAFSNAIQLIKRKEYGGIVYIRTSTDDAEKAEENGFRSGNDEKIAPFFTPVYDTLDFIVRSNHKDTKLKGREFKEFIEHKKEEMMERYNIEPIITLGLRGRTFTNVVAIIDEAQNYSRSSLQKVLTRFGKNCKIIIIGSNKQIDNHYITKHTNGLSVLLDACTKPQDNVRLHAVPLTKILRSDIAEFAERVFSGEQL